MERKIVSGVMLTLLFIGMLTLAFNIQPGKASGTIYIRADGSIEGTTDISTVDNITYTFTANIYDEIVVQRDSIVVDGADYTVQGTLVFLSKGIDLSYRNNVTLKNVEVLKFFWGIHLEYSSNNTLIGNNSSSNDIGIYLIDSSNNTLIGNNASSNNRDGIHLSYSSNNTLSGNTASLNNRFNFAVFGNSLSHFYNYVDTSNTVDGKPILYLIDVADTVHDAKTNAGTIYLINCNNITIRDLTLTKNVNAVSLWNTTNSKIENVTASNNGVGIRLEYSSNNTVIGNNASSNSASGIYLGMYSNNNVLSGNTASNNCYGIAFWFSSNNTLTGNTVSNNVHGIRLDYSSNNTITGNTVSDNGDGIILASSSNNTIFHNNLIYNNFQVLVETGCINTWDNGYPSGGNYWSNHVCTGNPSDGSQPYIIDANNTDRYPFQDPNGWVIQGDINGDGIVDIVDVTICALAMWSYPGHPRWNPIADLNNDGIINIFDLVIVGVNFGKKLPL